jgi:hypothetical protein
MANRTNAAYNGRLTNYAFGLSQDLSSALAEFIAPTIVVPATIGQYKKYDDKSAFQVYDTSRAVGGPATRLKFESSDPFYNCKPQALECPVDDSERDAAGDSGVAQQALDESKVQTLLSGATVSHEDKVIAAIKAAVSAVGAVGVWSNAANNDPISEIDAQIKAIALASGRMPNRIVFGLGAWSYFRSHSKVLARFPNAALVGVTEQQATGILLNPSMDIRIGVLSKDTKFGVAASKTNVVGDEVFIFYAQSNPTIYDPTFAKTFTGKRGGVTAVRTYRDEQARSDIHAMDWSEDIQVVSTTLVRRITIT